MKLTGRKYAELSHESTTPLTWMLDNVEYPEELEVSGATMARICESNVVKIIETSERVFVYLQD